MESVLKFYSIGYVAENKPRNDRFVNVTSVEDAGGLDDEVTFNPQKKTLKGQDRNGKKFDVVTTQDNTIPCEWLPCGSNRATPPDVVRTELVEIWRLGDTDQFFWRIMGLRDHLRTLETVIYAFSATPDHVDGPLDLTRCYFFEVSTHERLVTFQTSKANGEPYAYTFQLNTKEGTFLFQDDIGTRVEADSKNHEVRMINPDMSLFEMVRKKITIKADEQIQMICGDSIYTMKPGEVTTKSARVFVDGGGTTWEQVGAGLTVNGAKYTFT